jgi:hypothetical protein
MSFMDRALDDYKPPVADDLEIQLPAWRGQKKDAEALAEPRDLGQHGGAASDGSPADTHSEAAGTGANSEPGPQRDDPDDGEHTDSTEQEVAARAQAAATAAASNTEQAPEPVEQPIIVDVSEPEEADELELEPVPKRAAPKQPVNVKKELAKIPGSEPRLFEKTGFSSGGVDTIVVKRFPQPLVDRLRLSLASVVGGDFAESLSAPALITAFLIAKTGVELDVDANTAVATDVFRQVDPRLLAVEEKIDEMTDDIGQLAQAMKISLNRISETANIADGLEFAMAYLIAERVAGLSTIDVDETNVDVTQKKVLVARESIRKRARAQRTVEKHREGRRKS